MDVFEEKCKVIDRAVKHLITGEDIFSDDNNKQPMRVTKVINSAIQLKSLEVDTALLMLAKIVRRQKGISVDRVVQLLKADDIGKHIIRIMDTYKWAYHGFMDITDTQMSGLRNLMKYSLKIYDIYTGFDGDNIDSFVIRIKKSEEYNLECTRKNDIQKLSSEILDLHVKLYNTVMTDKELKDGEDLIRRAILINSALLDTLIENLLKDRVEYKFFIQEVFHERFIMLR